MIIDREQLYRGLNRNRDDRAPAFYTVVPFEPPEYPGWVRTWEVNGNSYPLEMMWFFRPAKGSGIDMGQTTLVFTRDASEEQIAETLAWHAEHCRSTK